MLARAARAARAARGRWQSGCKVGEGKVLERYLGIWVTMYFEGEGSSFFRVISSLLGFLF